MRRLAVAPAVGRVLRLRATLRRLVMLPDQTLDLVSGTMRGGMGEQQKMITGHFISPFRKSRASGPFDDLKVSLFCGYLKRCFLT